MSAGLPPPPGSLVYRASDGLQYIVTNASTAEHARLVASPELAEDALSLMESAPFIVRPREGTPPIRCESCGTPVSALPEKRGPDGEWKRGIWDAEDWRKHTARRCDWLRERNLPVR